MRSHRTPGRGGAGPPNNPTGLCPHVVYVSPTKLAKRMAVIKKVHCDGCAKDRSEKISKHLGICMTCGYIGCDRFTNKHGLLHWEELGEEHCLVTNGKFQVYCYVCKKVIEKQQVENIRGYKRLLKAQNSIEFAFETGKSQTWLRSSAKRLNLTGLKPKEGSFQPIYDQRKKTEQQNKPGRLTHRHSEPSHSALKGYPLNYSPASVATTPQPHVRLTSTQPHVRLTSTQPHVRLTSTGPLTIGASPSSGGITVGAARPLSSSSSAYGDGPAPRTLEPTPPRRHSLTSQRKPRAQSLTRPDVNEPSPYIGAPLKLSRGHSSPQLFPHHHSSSSKKKKRRKSRSGRANLDMPTLSIGESDPNFIRDFTPYKRPSASQNTGSTTSSPTLPWHNDDPGDLKTNSPPMPWEPTTRRSPARSLPADDRNWRSREMGGYQSDNDAVGAHRKKASQGRRITIDDYLPTNSRTPSVPRTHPRKNTGGLPPSRSAVVLTKVQHPVSESESVSTTEEIEEAPIRGLKNLGNTCFLNAVLQNLVESRALYREYLKTNQKEDGDLQQQLRIFMKEMWWGSTRKPYNPKRLLSAVCSVRKSFRGRAQQDSHEFLRTLIGEMRDEKVQKQRTIREQVVKRKVERWPEKICLEWLISHNPPFDIRSYLKLVKIKRWPPFAGKQLVETFGSSRSNRSAQKLIVKKLKAREPEVTRLKRELENLKFGRSPFLVQKGIIEADHEMTEKKCQDDFVPLNLVDKVFGGVLESSVTCRTCNTVSRTLEWFYDLSVPIVPPPSGFVPRSKRRKRGFRNSSTSEEDVSSVATQSTTLSLEQLKKEYQTRTLGVERLRGSASLKDILLAFTDPELLEAPNDYGCEECTKRLRTQRNAQRSTLSSSEESDSTEEEGAKLVRRTAVKRMLIARPPKTLTIHLKRFEHLPRLRKCNKQVPVLKTLDLRPYVTEEGRQRFPTKYRLFGIVVHSGGLQAGHYVAYTYKRRAQGKDGWYYFSDTSWKQVNEAKVLKSEAYLLFYERCEKER